MQIKNINIMYPNKENIIVVPITKRMKPIMSTHVCLISWRNINYKENGKKKAFLANPNINTVYPNVENMIVVPLIKKWRLLQVSKFVSFHRYALVIRKMLERKAFLANPKHQYRVSQQGKHDCYAHNKKNGDYYEYPGLSLFTDIH